MGLAERLLEEILLPTLKFLFREFIGEHVNVMPPYG